MIFSGLEHMRKVPFRDVLFHGLVRDEKGRKMSKSLGNGVDPLEVIDKYGADSLRFSLLQGVAPGNDKATALRKTRYRERPRPVLCCRFRSADKRKRRFWSRFRRRSHRSTRRVFCDPTKADGKYTSL